MIDFDNIDYLKNGNERQQKVYAILSRHRIMELLQQFDPILVGTFPINLDIESSDLDICCCFTDKSAFLAYLRSTFGSNKTFGIRSIIKPFNAIVANFRIEGFEVEIFGQAIPTKQQNGYRHMMVEYRILQTKGEAFRQQVITLKKQGLKTEPAFAKLLKLNGDPYQALLELEFPI